MLESNCTYKAGLYCRLSSDDGLAQDSSSILTQKMMLEKYCKENDLVVSDVYVDDGYSGLNYNRPSFNRLINDIESKKVNLVITKDLSRLGRDYIQTGYYTEVYFASKGVRYIAINDNIDTLKDNNDIAPFKNILNDMYAKDLSRKVKSAKRERAYKGYFIAAQAPFGYKKDPDNNNKLIIDEEAAEIVREIFRLTLLGKGKIYIAKEFTKRKIITPAAYKLRNGDKRFERFKELKGENFEYKWNYTTIQNILKNIVYVGDMENGKYEVQNYKTKKRVRVPQEKHIIVRNTHEPIIDREDFELVQKLIKSRHSEPVHNHENLFKGLIVCSQCGKRMILAVKKRSEEKKEIIYKCMHHYKDKDECPKHNQIHYDKLYNIIENKLKLLHEFMEDGNVENKILNRLKKDNNTLKDNKAKSKLEKRLIVLNKVTKKLYEDFVTGSIDENTYQQLLNDYQSEQRSLNEKLSEIKKSDNEIKDISEGIKKIKEIMKENSKESKLNRILLNKLIDRIEISPAIKIGKERVNEIKIIYNFIDITL